MGCLQTVQYIFTGRCQHYAISCICRVFTDCAVFTGRGQHYAMSCICGMFTDSPVFTGRCQHYTMSCICGVFTDCAVFTGRGQHYTMSCICGVFTDGTWSAVCYVMYLWDVYRLLSVYRMLSALCYVMFLWGDYRLFSIYGTLSALCYVMFFVEYFQIVQYLRDVVTATQSMSTVNASITTMGYSSEGREINVIKVREPPRMNRSIFKHVIYNEKMENRPL